jgi:hypothetical protein
MMEEAPNAYDRPHLSATAPVLTYLPALSYFLLRLQLLTPLSVLPWAGTLRLSLYHGLFNKRSDSVRVPSPDRDQP